MRSHALPLLLAPFLALAPAPLSAWQGGDDDAYRSAVGEHFDVPPAEVRILSEWPLPAQEIPAVLFVARRGGISAEAVVALRRTGRPWADLASRYGIHAGVLHVDLEGAPEMGPVTDAYREYADRPSSAWPAIRLSDEAFVALVNIRVLADILGASPRQVLDALVRAGTGPGAYRALVRGG